MNKPQKKCQFVIGMIFATMVIACQPISIPTTSTPEVSTPTAIIPTATIAPTPTAATWGQWGDPNTTVNIKARLGTGAAYALDISPDGETLAVASATGLAAYNFNSLKEIWRSPLELWKEVPGDGVSVDWSPDGKRLSASSAGNVTIWDAATGDLLNELKDIEQDNYVTSATWTPDGQRLVANVRGNGLAFLLFDAPAGKEISSPTIHDGMSFLPWMPNGKNMAVALANYEIVFLSWSNNGSQVISLEVRKMALRDVQSGKQIPVTYTIPQNRRATIVRWSPDDQKLATGIDLGTIIIWDVHTGELLHELRRKQTGNTDEVLSLAWSPDGKYLISLSRYEAITVWDAHTGEELRSLSSHTGRVMSLAWSPDASKLASGSEDGEVIIWNPQTGKKLLSLQDPSGCVSSLAWSPDGKRLASGGTYTTTIWEAQTGKKLKELSGQGYGIDGVAWSPDGKMFASVSGDGQGIIWDGTTYEQLRELKKGENIASAPNLAWSLQGDLLATGPWQDPMMDEVVHMVNIWDSATGEILYSKSGFSEFAWSPVNKDILAVAETMPDNISLVLWNYKTDLEITRLSPAFMIFELEWSRDGKLLLINSVRSISILDVKTGEQIHILEGHADSIRTVAWSPRGDLIATASNDGTVILWEIDTR